MPCQRQLRRGQSSPNSHELERLEPEAGACDRPYGYGRRVIVVYTGRRPSGADGAFPDANAEFVGERLSRLIAGLRPRLAVGSGAAGTDLLAAPAAADARAEVQIITAGPVDEFERASVADKGGEWTARLRGLVRRDLVHVQELDVNQDDEGFAAVNREVLDVARNALTSGEELVVVAVLGGRREGRDHTADLADEAAAAGHLVLRVDPALTRHDAPVAFVAMPYGLRQDPLPGRPDYDADLTWHRILVPALVDAGYRPLRVDLEASLEIIDAKMIRGIGQASLLVADLAHHNPNVFWELGVRHAWIPAGTVLVAPDGSPRPPFDVNHVSVHSYARGAQEVSDADTVAAIRLLRPILGSAHGAVDSPVFAALPDLSPQQIPPAADAETDSGVTDAAEQISLLADLQRADELVALAWSLSHSGMPTLQAAALREQAALALLVLRRASDALQLLAPLATADADLERITLQQRYALALMESTTPEDPFGARLAEAETLLTRLDARHPGSGETLGLLGSAAKRMFRRTSGPIANAHLDRALDAYLRGFQSDPQDYYPGVNAVALLRARAARTGSSKDADQARALVPVVRFMVDRPGVADTVWRRATVAELMLHKYRLDGNPLLEAAVRAYAAVAATAGPQQLASMRNQLDLLRALGDPPEAIDPILAVLADRV
jgi:hypothetical protein